jgi:biopolymer transport protein ExbD
MEATKIQLRPRKKARIEIIPLIDVIFFLLATFVLFTLSLNRIQSLPVDLPVANPNPAPPTPDDIMITIQVSAEDSIFWNRELIDAAELPARITNYTTNCKTNNKEPKILVTGDEKARFGATVVVLDEIRKAGIEKFSVETRTRPTGK